MRISHDSEVDIVIYDDDTRINTERLRSDLLDYFGTAAFSIEPLAMADVARVENADEDELAQIARECRWNLRKYCE